MLWVAYDQWRLSQQLILAIKAADVKRAENALNSGADPNSREETRGTIWERIVDHVFRPSMAMEQPTALMLATDLSEPLYNGPHERVAGTLVKALLAHGASSNLPVGRYAETPLDAAIRSNLGRSEVIKALIEHGGHTSADPPYDDLCLAIESNADLEIIELLLKRGSNPDAEDHDQKTPLSYAILRGDLPIVRTLLRYHANPSALTITYDPQSRPLRVAQEEGKREVYDLLKSAGAR